MWLSQQVSHDLDERMNLNIPVQEPRASIIGNKSEDRTLGLQVTSIKRVPTNSVYKVRNISGSISTLDDVEGVLDENISTSSQGNLLWENSHAVQMEWMLEIHKIN